MLDFLFHHMLDFFARAVIAQHNQLAFVDLLSGTFTRVVNAQKALNVSAVSHRVCSSPRVYPACLFANQDIRAKPAISRLRMLFQPAIEMPNSDHGTSSQRTTGVASN